LEPGGAARRRPAGATAPRRSARSSLSNEVSGAPSDPRRSARSSLSNEASGAFRPAQLLDSRHFLGGGATKRRTRRPRGASGFGCGFGVVVTPTRFELVLPA